MWCFFMMEIQNFTMCSYPFAVVNKNLFAIIIIRKGSWIFTAVFYVIETGQKTIQVVF